MRGPAITAAILFGWGALTIVAQEQEKGAFETETDVGVSQPGSLRIDPVHQEYRITGGGANMWGAKDAFHYVWRRLSGDLVLTAQVSFPEPEGSVHRKAGWIVRAGLEDDAAYADGIVHADGLIALQYRLAKGGPTLEIRSPVRAPAAIRLERTGDLFSLSVARGGREFQPVGSVTVVLPDGVYAGLGVCAHDATASATAVFSRVDTVTLGSAPAAARVLESRLEVISVDTGEREVAYATRDHIEAPNWSRDGRSFLFNSAGRLYSLPREGGQPHLVDTGSAKRLNNDHGLSPDGRRIAISHAPGEDSLIYVLPAEGGEPRQVTALGPSYWHGWSPDGKSLVYCARRHGEYDVYSISAEAELSTEEKRLTTAPGLDDGPDFTPDGRTIFFNSQRTGRMRIWCMSADGSDQRQVTHNEEYEDWFPHPSPDARWLAFLSYEKGVEGHPPNKDVALRIMPLAGGEPRILARVFGGQGTINVPSWSPDSRSLAFVSYRLINPGAARP